MWMMMAQLNLHMLRIFHKYMVSVMEAVKMKAVKMMNPTKMQCSAEFWEHSSYPKAMERV
jgi:hypothetical protein